MKSARDAVYEALHERLTHGHYPADATLIPQALSDEFGVSRTPVREALALLERKGLLIAASRGFVLRIRSDEEMLEIFEVRAILESSAAAAAAERHTPVDIARLREALAQSASHTDPVEIRHALNVFHDCVMRAAHNQTIYGMERDLRDQIKVSAPWFTPTGRESFESSVSEHEQILSAIIDGSAEKARLLMLEHLNHDRDVRISQLVSRTMGVAAGESPSP
ncbi:GntR family transcriptional regulator [Gordonia metallireducens]|uniref:GntR family transcriptional regulator n=1 Tax=Gordonia metallireducens TaxID=2897779 RepID=UPI001E3446C8|nr:GntR family transcriptional regulator [Gordonia metallireducens]